MRALVYGTLNPDLVHRVHTLPGPGDDVRSTSWSLTWGGKAANAAMALATWGVDTLLTGLVIGTDTMGDALLGALGHASLDLSLVERSPDEATRHCVIVVDDSGDRTIVCSGYEGARWSTVPADLWGSVDVCLIDGFGGPAATAVAAAARSRATAVVWLDCPTDATDLADVVVWSAHEHGPADVSSAGSRVTILTAGPDTVSARVGDRRIECAPPSIAAVDATGAGDVFAAACARGVALGWEWPEILHWASAAGAALAATGRSHGMPSVAAVDVLL